MTLRTSVRAALAAATMSSAMVAAAPVASAHEQAAVAPAARPGSPWQTPGYRPRPGDWRAYVLSPRDRTLAPAAVADAQPRQGSITGDPAGALRAGGAAVRLTSTGARTGSPLLVLDFGQEVAGKVSVRLSGASDPAPALHACFSESRRFMAGLGSPNDGEDALAPGCDTANIWSGYPGLPYTWDADSHTLTLPAGGRGTATDTQRRGGFRYLTLFLDGPGSVDVDAVSLAFTPAPHQGRDLSRYAGSFESSDDTLNKIWYAGAYTVQLDTDAADTAKSWPYATGEADHADAPVPHADPNADVIFDGGKRDRIVWQGDLGVQAPVSYLTTDDVSAVDNSLSSLAAQQEPDGFMPAESLVGQHNRDEERSYGEYVTWFVNNMAEHWRYTGDRGYLQRWWPALQRAVAWLESQRDAQGLIAFQASGSCGHYGYGDCGHETYVNALYARNLDQMATLAGALGDRAGAASYQARGQAVAAAINAQLWDDQAGAYRLSLETPNVHPQDANAAAVLTGVATGERAARALDFLKAHTWSALGSLNRPADEPTSVMGLSYQPLPSGMEAEARLQRGDATSALELIRRFWGYQLSQDPGSTFWEHMTPDGVPDIKQFTSLAHGWAAEPTVALTTRVLGINPTAPGFSEFEFAPQPGDLSWAEGTVPTPHGPIRAAWRREHGRLRMSLTVPRGTRAHVLGRWVGPGRHEIAA
jgi:hypothetical protein